MYLQLSFRQFSRRPWRAYYSFCRLPPHFPLPKFCATIFPGTTFIKLEESDAQKEGKGARMDNAKIVPLMPREKVLFPGMLLPLHVTQPRYLLFVNRCLDRHGEFGVVLATDNPLRPHRVGTLAKIIDYEPREDGMTLLLTGTQRFTVGEMVDDEPYLTAMIEPHPLICAASPEELDIRAAQARRLFSRCIRLIASHRGADAQSVPILPIKMPDLGWAIAAALAIPLAERQRLLEKENPTSLLQSEILYLESLVAQLRHGVEDEL